VRSQGTPNAQRRTRNAEEIPGVTNGRSPFDVRRSYFLSIARSPFDAAAAGWCDACDAAAEAVHVTLIGRLAMSKFRKIAGCLIVAAAVTGGALISTHARGQEKPDQKAMMEAWQKSMTPGKEHEAMAAKVGSWKLEMTDYSGGGEHKNEATAEIKMLMGGRYQEVKVKGNVMGQPFEGCSTTGFDNIRKVYINTWIDSMGTSITTAEGKATDDKTVEMKGQMSEPMAGGMIDFRTVMKDIDADHFTYEMYTTMQGQEKKAISITYERVK
jgi:hypothetical protein